MHVTIFLKINHFVTFIHGWKYNNERHKWTLLGVDSGGAQGGHAPLLTFLLELPLLATKNRNVARFRKINDFVTFDTLNISNSNNALHSTNKHCSEHRISLYHELPEILWNILRSTCALLWQQRKVLDSIYFTRDKVVDFPKSGHKYSNWAVTFSNRTVTYADNRAVLILPAIFFEK